MRMNRFSSRNHGHLSKQNTYDQLSSLFNQKVDRNIFYNQQS
jgi:hypothetical protein